MNTKLCAESCAIHACKEISTPYIRFMWTGIFLMRIITQ